MLNEHDTEAIKAIEILMSKGITLGQIAEAYEYLDSKEKEDNRIAR